MRAGRRLALVAVAVAVVAACLATPAARAQEETFEIGLSTDVLSVGTNFAGAQLVVFGVLEGADQRILRQGRYDIAVVLEGPVEPIVVRERERFLGIWVNGAAERFEAVPQSYSLSATRPLRDVAQPPLLQQLSLGVTNLAFNRIDEWDPERERSVLALQRLRHAAGLYVETTGTIDFVSGTLFRAAIALPPDIPVGRHTVRAFLFREGNFVQGRSETLWVRKTGIESSISLYAANNGAVYGLFSVLLAFAVGWTGRILFRRD